MPNQQPETEKSRTEALQEILRELREQKRQTSRRESAAGVLKGAVEARFVKMDLRGQSPKKKVFTSTVLNNMKHRPEVEQLDRLQCELLNDYDKLHGLVGRLEALLSSDE